MYCTSGLIEAGEGEEEVEEEDEEQASSLTQVNKSGMLMVA